ncbi:benzoate 4-monooxygenase cytochrome P450 [Histoplasma capsulatum var. duboisii H88]|uniref:Benzoate 4-monooxygenase cytochrome P450 n=1 Tax=Ajellomyces capsulatus (strain H88) TaxID=544711 RepID=A0A8A1LL68_AJEC8|nr:benzoate 4-monooxygenase cytochrome P450 [Histoplasma capsulatum var. duboisii H88]
MTFNALFTTVTTALLLPILIVIKTLYFHPLSRYNGPTLWAITRLPYMLAFRSGKLAHKVKHFHEVYGDTVRVAPNEVSFINPSCVKDIYNRRPSSEFKSLPKDPIRQPPPQPGQPISILEAGDEDHARIRKSYASLFSSKALAAQEPLVSSYVHKMISQLKLQTGESDTAVVDLQTWVSYCTFDIICSLSFGEDFGCLENNRYHEWVGMLVYSLKGKVQLAACRFYPWLFRLLLKRIPKSAMSLMAKHQATTREKVDRRLSSTVDRPDFLSHLQNSKHQLSHAEIVTNSTTFVFAGSHTLQTAITGILFHLLHNPESLAKVTEEVRASFATTEDIEFRNLSKLPLLDAAITEGIRLSSPVPLGLTRLVPEGGHTINGEFFPAGTTVSYMQWAANLSASNFADSTSFHLDRWLHTDRDLFANDRRDAVQPFLQGPRDCIGQNLARMEISLILGHLLYQFNLSPPTGEGHAGVQRWEDQETYAVWVKSPLPVRLSVR